MIAIIGAVNSQSWERPTAPSTSLSVPSSERNENQHAAATTSGTTQAAMTTPFTTLLTTRPRPRWSSAMSRPRVFWPMTADPITKTNVRRNELRKSSSPSSLTKLSTPTNREFTDAEPVSVSLVKAM